METVIQDLRLAWRSALRRPGYAAAVALTLGLGLGANSALFAVVDAVLLRPLPYPDPERLAVVWVELPGQDRFRVRASGPELQALHDRAGSLAAVGGVWARPGVLRGGDGPAEEVEVGWITPGFLEAFGVEPALGRWPTRAEHLAEEPSVIVLSHGLWQGRHGGDPGILGRRVEFDDVSWTVVGVMPAGFDMLLPPDQGVPERLTAWLPWGGGLGEMSTSFRVFTPVARLRPGVAPSQAGAELAGLATAVRDADAGYARSGLGLRLEPLAADAVAHVSPLLLLLAGVAGFVLMIACANVANLALARAGGREREIAVRAALGAGRVRLVRQALTESLLLGALGAGAGLLLAELVLLALRRLEPGRLPRLHEVSIDGRALAFTAAATLATALAFGLVAAVRSLRRGGLEGLRDGTRGSSPRGALLRRSLVASQLSLSLVLLAGAGLLLRSFLLLLSVDPGFEPRGVLTLRLSLPDVHYRYSDRGEKIAAFYRRLDERLAGLPGVVAVGATLEPPLSGRPLRPRAFAWRERGGESEWGSQVADARTVTPGWFRAAGVRLVAGRFLEPRDDRAHPVAVVVDTSLARRAWPGRAAVGQPLRVELFRDGRFGDGWGEVVGVVEPVRHERLESLERPQYYLAHAQVPQRTMYPTLRVEGDPLVLLPAIQREVDALEKDLPVFDVRLADEHVARATALSRFALAGLLGLAGLALALAAAGVFAVVALGVDARRRELGIRHALGASPVGLVGLVMRDGIGTLLAGLAAGFAGAMATGRVLSGLLFGVPPGDPVALITAGGALVAVALLAAWLPARRAARVDPAEALRADTG